VDTPTREELIGANLKVDEIAKFIGADSLGYLSLEGLLRACDDTTGNRHCTACYTNNYPIPVTSGARTKTEREEGSLLEDAVWPRT
jgi:amidophosphoribosyltransferase